MKEYLKITNEDNMDLMARYEDNHFDLAIVDPPYGKNPHRNSDGFGVAKRNYESGSTKWDFLPIKEYWNELFRVSKNQIVWGGNYFIEHLYSTNSFIFWDKEKSFKDYADGELAWTSFNKAVKKYRFAWNGMIQGDMKNKEVRIHPTQKPVKLYEWLLMNYAKEGDKILDTHLGSGSIAIAIDNVNKIEQMNLELTACELDKEYFEASLKRIENQTKQQKLF